MDNPPKHHEYKLTRSESQKSHKIECPQPIVGIPVPAPTPPPSTPTPATPTPTTPTPATPTPATPTPATPTPATPTPATPTPATPTPATPTPATPTLAEPIPATPTPTLLLPTLETPFVPVETLLDKRKSKAVQEVAGAAAGKNQPMLMKLRKLDSLKHDDKDDKESGDSSENTDTERSEQVGNPQQPSKSSSYTVTIVGGVIQKIPTAAGVTVEKPTPPESPVLVMRRHNKPGKRMDRRVSCKDLGKGDCEGWLYKKKKTHSSLLASKWHKRWFVLKNYNLYYYKHQEDLRAEGVIHLPSFKVSPEAPEVKGITGSRKRHAFKVYNTGTAFFFASDRQEDMTKWMNKMGLAAIVYAPKSRFTKPESSPTSQRRQHPILEDVDYSESDEESEITVQSGKGDNSSSSDKQDDYTSILRSLEKADLAIDGTNINVKRRSAITSQDVLKEPSNEQSDGLNRIVLLERTIKSKELLVKAIDRLLCDTVTTDRLTEFSDNYPDLTQKKIGKPPKGRQP